MSRDSAARWWEHKMLTFNTQCKRIGILTTADCDLHDRTLNQRGAEGWERVATSKIEGGRFPQAPTHTFKRTLPFS